MKKYRVEGISVTVHSGVISVTEAQAGKRAHALNSLGFGRYEVTAPVGFKRGEEFGFNGQINKALLVELADLSELSEPKEEGPKKKKVTKKKTAGKK